MIIHEALGLQMLHGKKQKKVKQRSSVKPQPRQLEVQTHEPGSGDCSTGEAVSKIEEDGQVLEGLTTQLR